LVWGIRTRFSNWENLQVLLSMSARRHFLGAGDGGAAMLGRCGAQGVSPLRGSRSFVAGYPVLTLRLRSGQAHRAQILILARIPAVKATASLSHSKGLRTRIAGNLAAKIGVKTFC